MKITDYKVASTNTNDELEKQVVKLLKCGWTPQGGINMFVMHTPDGAYAMSTQAMIKKKTNCGRL